MNVLLLSIGNLKDVNQHEIYTDLLREFRNNGHSVYAVSTYERRVKKNTSILLDMYKMLLLSSPLAPGQKCMEDNNNGGA